MVSLLTACIYKLIAFCPSDSNASVAMKDTKRTADGGCKRKRDDGSDVMAASSDSSSANGYEIVSVKQWLTGWSRNVTDNSDEASDILPLVDLRSYEEFNTIHLQSSTNDESPLIVNLPIETLVSGERSCELPPRHVEFAILVPSKYAESFLLCNAECCIHKLFFASKSSATQQSRKPWLVRQVILESEQLWNEKGVINNIKQGSAEVNSESRNNATFFRPLPRLWKPDPLMSELLPLLKEWMKENCSPSRNEDNYQSAPCTVFDLGSGAGRDVCYLAEETKAFYYTSILQQQSRYNHFPLHFVGIDNHKGSAKRCEPLWRNRGIQDITRSRLLNLNKLDLVSECFTNTMNDEKSKPTNVVCIYAIRYLNRKLLSCIANSASNIESMDSKSSSLCLPIGTIVGISHFCKPTKTAEWNFDHPKVSNVLDRDELRTLFDDKCWSILKDDICSDGDHGRTLIQFIARKIA